MSGNRISQNSQNVNKKLVPANTKVILSADVVDGSMVSQRRIPYGFSTSKAGNIMITLNFTVIGGPHSGGDFLHYLMMYMPSGKGEAQIARARYLITCMLSCRHKIKSNTADPAERKKLQLWPERYKMGRDGRPLVDAEGRSILDPRYDEQSNINDLCSLCFPAIVGVDKGDAQYGPKNTLLGVIPYENSQWHTLMADVERRVLDTYIWVGEDPVVSQTMVERAPAEPPAEPPAERIVYPGGWVENDFHF